MLIRILLNTVGLIAVVLGLIGVFLPLLPTTPFLLLALACFARGSDRMHSWLLNNRILGPTLQNIINNKGIPLKTKIIAISFLWVSLAISAYIMPVAWARPLLLIPGLGVTIYLWRYKTL